MKSRITVLIVVTIMLLSAGCNGDRREYSRLVELEQVLEQNPDSVRSVLYAMPTPKKERSKALYTVLKTQADYKCYEPLESDSLMLEATAYYGTGKKDYYAALAYYTLGCLYDENGNDIAALEAYLKAKDLFPDTLIRYYALTECLLGLKYVNSNAYDYAENHLLCAMNNADRLNDVHTYCISRYNYALCLLHRRDFETAEQYFLEFLDNEAYYEYYRINPLLQLAKIYYIHYKDYDKSLLYVNRFLNLSKSNNEAGLAAKANIFYDMAVYDSAYHYCLKSLKTATELNTICLCYDKLTELSLIDPKYSDSIFFSKYKDVIDTLFDGRNLNKINNLHYIHSVELAEHELRHKQKLLVCYAVFIPVCLSLLTMFMITALKKRKKEKLWQKKDNISRIECEIYNNQLENRECNESANTVSENDLDIFSKLLAECKELFLLSDANTILVSHTAVVREEYTEAEIEHVKKNVLEIFRPAIVFLSNQCKTIDNRGVLICVLSYLGYNSAEISLFLNVSAESVRQRKKRMKESLGTELYKCIFMKSIRNNV